LVLEHDYLGCVTHSSSLIANRESGAPAVIDPQRDVEHCLEDATRPGCWIAQVFLTHVHADFVAGHLDSATAKAPGSPSPRARSRPSRRRPDRRNPSMGDGTPDHALRGSMTANLHAPRHSFTLVTPNWTIDLPGSPYRGDDPEGHVERDEIVRYLEDYSTTWRIPVREGVRVRTLTAGSSSRFKLTTSEGDIEADVVVVCTGAFQRPQRPVADQFPRGLTVLDALDYLNPDAQPNGNVLLIGSDQTGCRWPRNFTAPAATCSCPAGARRGCRGAWTTSTS
jgi:hypothetical protein